MHADHQMVPGQARAVADDVGQGVGRLQRRYDALQLGAQLESGQGFPIGGRDVVDTPLVVKPGMLRADARVIEAGGDRMSLGNLAVIVLQ